MAIYRKVSLGDFTSTVKRMTQKEIAICFDISDRAVRDWRNCPRNKDNSYNLTDVIKWRISEAETKMAGFSPLDPAEDSEALEEWRKERVLITRMERQQLESKLAPISEWERALTERAFELTRRLLLLSRRVAHKLAATSKKAQNEVVDILDGEVRAMMNEYAKPVELELEPIKK